MMIFLIKKQIVLHVHPNKLIHVREYAGILTRLIFFEIPFLNNPNVIKMEKKINYNKIKRTKQSEKGAARSNLGARYKD